MPPAPPRDAQPLAPGAAPGTLQAPPGHRHRLSRPFFFVPWLPAAGRQRFHGPTCGDSHAPGRWCWLSIRCNLFVAPSPPHHPFCVSLLGNTGNLTLLTTTASLKGLDCSHRKLGQPQVVFALSAAFPFLPPLSPPASFPSTCACLEQPLSLRPLLLPCLAAHPSEGFHAPFRSSLQHTTFQKRTEWHPTSPALLHPCKQALLKAVQLLPPTLGLAPQQVAFSSSIPTHGYQNIF